MKETIKIIVTGGTFDKQYNELNGSLHFTKTHIYEMLQLGRSRLALDVKELMLLDSLQMTKEHREEIALHCNNTDANKIVITHGTDTMAETAVFLADLKIEKTIILTGAMVPYQFGSSDGLFNLGSSLAFSQVLPFGVYISMNGKYFDAYNVRKNKEIGEFEVLQ
ncbi:asparaginase domain-containing protein [Flavicella sediminum]|uniref:asparaginase domain-containing protein n=1 Tax=Flavicella sediminum TaxID=2585141 RepID=UPI00111DFA71|nr:asparaginase domain-containing protein [Flavicella sediminum]